MTLDCAWSHGGCLRGPVKRSEDSSGRCGPDLYNVEEAARFLDCCERQLRQEVRELKITHRRGPGGIRFTKEDLLERLRPIGGPSALSRQSTSSFKLLNAVFDEALNTLGDTLRNPSGHTTEVVGLLEACLCGEPCEDVSFLDANVAKAFGVIVAARIVLGKNADSSIRKLLNKYPDQT